MKISCKLINLFVDIPKFPVKIDNVSVNDGQTASFLCQFISNPLPETIQWFKNECEEMTVTEMTLIEKSDTTTTLILKETKLGDTGSTFSVKIKNELGEAESNKAKLNVSAGPVFIENPSDQSVLKDKEVRFECSIRSNPKPTVSWFFNGKELTIKDGVKIEKDVANDKYSLVIPKIAEKNVGTYTVKATNEFGSEERLCKLDILDLPKILNKLDNLTVNETQSAQFTVKFSGKPTPKVEWFKDDTKIEMTENIEIDESVENSVTIVIKSSSSVEHAGSYFAKVSNEFGDVASNKAMLTINSEYFTFSLNVLPQPIFFHFFLN